MLPGPLNTPPNQIKNFVPAVHSDIILACAFWGVGERAHQQLKSLSKSSIGVRTIGLAPFFGVCGISHSLWHLN